MRSVKALPLTCSVFSVFIKFSALALSNGLPDRLMLKVMPRSANNLR
jgi:hypothetical protein